MERDHTSHRRVRLYCELSDRMEKGALKLIGILVVLLVAYQLLMQVPWLNKYLTPIGRMEGTPVRMQDPAEVQGH
ncbi:hypothetical protein MKY59_19530 [Paenibacillus sp. FSL W8-0426]|uniref:hypothetical protein n=1 Tax=Paenibacillus sp. FSL W8-0426 TaxID=2921714 RepID=UPI0030D70425